METIKASEFEARCAQFLEDVARTGEVLTITRNGIPVVRIVPVRARRSPLIGMHQGMIEICNDIQAPIDISWDAVE